LVQLVRVSLDGVAKQKTVGFEEDAHFGWAIFHPNGGLATRRERPFASTQALR
jgi:hypothetical protein